MENTIESKEFRAMMYAYRRSSSAGAITEAYQALIAHIDKSRAERDRRIVATTVEACAKCVPGGSLCDPQHVADAIRAIAPESVLAGIDKKQDGAA